MNWGENMLKIGICDDSTIFLICAEKLIRKWSDERRIPVKIYTFNNGDKLVCQYRRTARYYFFGHYHASFKWYGCCQGTSSAR